MSKRLELCGAECTSEGTNKFYRCNLIKGHMGSHEQIGPGGPPHASWSERECDPPPAPTPTAFEKAWSEYYDKNVVNYRWPSPDERKAGLAMWEARGRLDKDYWRAL